MKGINIKKKTITIIALVFIFLVFLACSVFAGDAINPDDYEPSNDLKDSEIFLQRAAIVTGFIKYVGMVVSILGLTIIGMKYLFGSVEEKADYKKSMVPYVFGLAMLAGVSIIINFIEAVARG